jgi:hypothetical protein
MITEALIIGLIGIASFILNIFNLPAMPSAIVDGGDWIITQVVGAVSFFREVLSAPILAAMIVVFIAYFAFETLYHTTMWIVRKIPIGIK